MNELKFGIKYPNVKNEPLLNYGTKIQFSHPNSNKGFQMETNTFMLILNTSNTTLSLVFLTGDYAGWTIFENLPTVENTVCITRQGLVDFLTWYYHKPNGGSYFSEETLSRIQ